jgi:hypothetical protein
MAATHDTKWTPGSNFPGLKLGTTIAESWLRLLTDQVSLVNDAWRRIQGGSFGFADYTRSAASLWESYLRTVSDIARIPFPATGPQWVSFVYDRERPALKRTVTLPEERAESVQLAVTPLSALGASDVIDRSAVSVSFAPNSSRRDTVEILIGDPSRLGGYKDGQYMGFVYDRRSQGGPPLIVIVLTIDRGA